MAPPHTSQSPQKEGRLNLAIHSLQNRQLKSQRSAAKVYKVPRTTLQRRLRGTQPKLGSRHKNRILLVAEEAELIQWIGSMEQRGFPPFLIDVKRMAQVLRARRGSSAPARAIGKNWIYRFLKKHPALKARLQRSRDAQRAKNEDPRVIRPWFQRIKETREKYGIPDEDVYNFDETGFAMGLIGGSGSSKVVGLSDSVGRATVIQPGDRTWTTVIEGINATGWAIPPFVILEGKVHLQYWYQEQGLPTDWTIAVSPNGWTNDELGVHFIKHFDKWTKPQTKGTYRLLLLDGHGSHATPEFDTYCQENHIITECLPPHILHILQPLDVGCFSPLKAAYRRLVQDLARQAVFHVDKADFLRMYRQARSTVHSEQNIKSGFRATGLVPWDPNYVLSQLPHTPSPPATSHDAQPASSPWISGTPINLAELAKQTQLVTTAIKRQSQSPTEPLAKVVKGCEKKMVKVVLLEQRVIELETSLERKEKKKQRSRAQLQHGGILEVQEAQNLIQAREVVIQREITPSSQQTRQRAPPTCSRCHNIGHTRTQCNLVNYTS
jgi:DDE superfamily endonuclease/Psq-like protein/Tc5 transposase-like DNA-binding protein